MAVHHLNHEGNFVQIHKPFLLDDTHKETSKVVLSIALCYKHDTNVTPNMLSNHMAAGSHAIRSAIHDLETRGYAHIQQERYNGKYSKVIYDYYETPELSPYYNPESQTQSISTPPHKKTPDTDLPQADSPNTAKPHRLCGQWFSSDCIIFL